MDVLMEWMGAIAAIVAAASAVAKITPNKTDDKCVYWALRIIDVIALTTGKTKLK